jgi:two-component system cell cycle sensor histidine kinase/response regulator CckA
MAKPAGPTDRASELLEAERLLQGVLDGVRDGLMVLDRDLKVVRVNAWIKERYAFQGALTGRKCHEALQKRDAPCPWCPGLLTLETGEEHSAIVPLPSVDGVEQWMEVVASPLRDAAGQVIGLVEQAKDVTDRRRAEEAVKGAEEEKGVVLDSVSEHVIFHDPEMRMIWANRAAARSVGKTTEELTGQHCYEIWQGRDEPCLGCPVVKALASGKTEEMEMGTPDGRSWLVRGHPVRNRAGEIIGAVEVTLEITQRKRAEEALRLTKFSIDRARDATLWIASDGRLVYVNDQACRSLGYSRAELLSMAIPDIDPNMPSESWAGAWATLKQRGVAVQESRYRRKDGGTFPVEITANYVEFGGKEYNFAFVRDLTDRERAEADRAVTQRRYRELYESSRDGYALVDMDGTIVEFNSAFRDMLGYSDDELRAKTYEDITPPRWHEIERRVLDEQVLPRGYSDVYEKEYIRKDGTILPIEIRTSLLTEADGRPTGMWAFVRDVTQSRLLEEQFRQAQKMEATGRLAGGIAHDFNNQLTVIKGYCDLLLGEMTPDAPLRSELEEIQRASQRAQRLTSQLLAFSRRQVLRPEVLNLNDVLAEMQDPLSRMIGRDVQLEIVPNAALGNARADRSQVEQTVMNLAVNAWDAMPRGGWLRLETANVELDDAYARRHPDANPGPYVMLAVTDTGEGMDEETRRRIFEPFFTTKDVGKGTGLGLSMVYGFVKQSGGLIEVTSHPGQGSRFELYLPRAAEEASAPPPQEQQAPAQPVSRPVGSETVLVVEDDDAVRQLILRTLRQLGYTVLEAADGREALSLGRDGDRGIDLLVTDVIMPGMEGPELARQLVASQSGLRVLYISGYTDNSVVHPAGHEPTARLLSKPFHPDALAETVRRVLDEDADPASDAAPSGSP